MIFDKLSERLLQRVGQILGAALLFLRKQTRQRNFHQPRLRGDRDAEDICSGGQVFMLLHGGKAVDQMPHPAGDLLCAERCVGGEQLIVFRITESMMSEDVRKRELAPLQSIRDNYEKNVLSLEPGFDASYDGIKSENLIEWLLSE